MSRLSRSWQESKEWPLWGQISFASLMVLVAGLVVGVYTSSSNEVEENVPSGARPVVTTSSSTRDLEQLLTPLALVEPTAVPEYERALFGGDWRDSDHDCESTRTEVLIQQSRITPVVLGCEVISGLWKDPWSSAEFTDPTEIDIDHTVPLANAWRSGAWKWSTQRRADFANDLRDVDALVAVSSSENRAKGDSGPDQWRPPSRNSWCRYARSWARTKAKWGLSATRAEWLALQSMVSMC